MVKRDIEILNEVYRWRFCLSRHIKWLLSFGGERACDRRLKILVENGYLERRKILYGIPYLYYVSRQGRKLIYKNLREEKIKIDNIHHNITVLDNLPKLMDIYHFELNDLITEREMHVIDGFSVRKHHPDFIYKKDGLTCAVEFELSMKSKKRFLYNIEQNYLNYDKQIWVVPYSQKQILNILENEKNNYEDVEVIILESLV